MIIHYAINLFPVIKTEWVTEITQIKEKEYFVDEQIKGPYKIWHHQHFIEPSYRGTLMRDIVSYEPPMGFIGGIANKVYIGNKLESIFDFRTKAVLKHFESKEANMVFI
jgi:ligand-binding SRPBCC domain-containing protein